MFNNTMADLHQYTVEGAFPAIEPGWYNQFSSSPITLKTYYLNTLPHPLTIVTRNGLRHVVMPATVRGFQPAFIIRHEYKFNFRNWNDIDTLLAGLPPDKYQFLHTFKKHWEELKRMPRTMAYQQEHCMVVDYVIQPNVFFDRKSIYYRVLDLVISRSDLLSAPPHPAHPDAAQDISLNMQGGDVDPTSNMTLQMELIEGTDPIAPRYIAISNRVFKITAKKDARREPGLYMTSLEKDPENPGQMRSIQQRFTLDEMQEKLSVYKTPDEALVAGDLSLARKAELNKMDQDLAMSKRELEALKIKNEQDRLAAEAQTRQLESQLRDEAHKQRILEHEYKTKESEASFREGRLKSDLAMFKENMERETKVLKDFHTRREIEQDQRMRDVKEALERSEAERKIEADRHREEIERRALQRKDDYEKRSQDRKDTSEIVKFLPAILVGIGAVVLAAFKFFTSPSK